MLLSCSRSEGWLHSSPCLLMGIKAERQSAHAHIRAQVLGRDVHVAWVVGEDGLQSEGAELGLDADWLQHERPPSDCAGAP
jgi:hypothetical protein